MEKKVKHPHFRLAITAVFVIWLAVSAHNSLKPMPLGTSVEGEIHSLPPENIAFLYDLTYTDTDGERVYEQEIFDEIYSIVDSAERFIVLDMFLFNQDYPGKDELLPLSATLKNKLIERKSLHPEMEILFVTDPINNFYGSYESELITELKDAGVTVVVTDLTKLRDSNMLYSSMWRTYLQWFGTRGEGWLAHPLGNTDHDVTLRSYLSLLNTKANHRKLIVADEGESIVSFVTSANPHDASGYHSNVAIKIEGGVWEDILESEYGIAAFSGTALEQPDTSFVTEGATGEATVQFLSEGAIKRGLLTELETTTAGDAIDIAMFYLSDKDVVQALLDASSRGVAIRLILDPNKDAFSREKNGIPNRQVAYELVKATNGEISLRWFNTNGEQFHTKMIVVHKANGRMIIFLGSANITRRNIDDLNLEGNVKVTVGSDAALAQEIRAYYERIWSNDGGIFTLGFTAYEDGSILKQVVYHIQESTGLSTF